MQKSNPKDRSKVKSSIIDSEKDNVMSADEKSDGIGLK